MNLDEVLHKTMVDVREHELSGMVCNDTNGLCLAAAPPDEARFAGAYQSIIRKAATLSTDVDTPVVLIETDSRNIMIRECDNVVIAAIQQRNS